ncbi:unnamed protein product [Mycena citricolor]|uniref:Uncharacterized protein n=1 Tax=Mycena citricolor TaxID=2018698 RepID=A0AAD2K843_9AGAR|nr:unnamed protein product [Mycena citricolor]
MRPGCDWRLLSTISSTLTLPHLFFDMPAARIKRKSTLKRSRSSSDESDLESPRKKQCKDAYPKFPALAVNFEKMLERLSDEKVPVNYLTVRALRGLATERECATMVQAIVNRAKRRVEHKFQGLRDQKKLLECELFDEWLRECDFVLKAVVNILRAPVQTAIGKTLFMILYHLFELYVTAVDAQQDGWSSKDRYSWVMSFVQEANDSSTDGRSDAAVISAEARLNRYDIVMVRALQRYRADCMDPECLAASMERMENDLDRSCCLLSEQTGFGDADEMSQGLLKRTRDAMVAWNDEGYIDGDCESSGVEEARGFDWHLPYMCTTSNVLYRCTTC